MADNQHTEATVVLPADAPRDTWEAARTQGLGGSDVAAACGLIAQWTTPFQLWLEKTGRINSSYFNLAAEERMYWGRRLEPIVLEEWDARHPEYILTGGAGMYADPQHPWMLANVDGLAWDADGELAGIVEAKAGGHKGLSFWDDDAVPIHYVCQAQWYMRLLGAPRAFVAALLDTNQYIERVIERDDDLIEDLVDTAAEFWDYVLRDEPPPGVDATDTTRKALSRWQGIPGEVVELDPLWAKHIAHRHELSNEIKALETERTAIDNHLRATMGCAEEAHIDGQKVATHRAPAKPSRSCDYEALLDDHPDLYAAYVTETPATRRLTFSRTNPNNQ